MPKKPSGSGSKPNVPARGLCGMDIPMATTASTDNTNGREGVELTKGIRRVRITNTMKVWVASDSTNQPARNNGADAWNTHNMKAKVAKSYNELIGRNEQERQERQERCRDSDAEHVAEVRRSGPSAPDRPWRRRWFGRTGVPPIPYQGPPGWQPPSRGIPRRTRPRVRRALRRRTGPPLSAGSRRSRSAPKHTPPTGPCRASCHRLPLHR